MNLLQQFVEFLNNQKSKPSFLTVKNYKADISQFIAWFEKQFNSAFEPLKVTSQIITQYKKSRNLSPVSFERHTSSLRKFFNFLQTNKIITQDPLEKKIVSPEEQALTDPWMIRNFKSYLYQCKKSDLTIKNYINDIKSFFAWLTEVSLTKYSWDVTEKNLLNKINYSILDEYKQRLISSNFSPLTINRKLSSLRSYITWAQSNGFTPKNSENSEIQIIRNSDYQKIRQSDEPSLPSIPNYSSLPPLRLMQKSLKGINLLFDNLFILPIAQAIESIQDIFRKDNSFSNPSPKIPTSNIQKEFYAPLNISTHYLPAHKKVWHYIRHVRPNWYKKYHSYSITHYFHFAMLVIIASAIGFGLYNEFFAHTQNENGVLGISTNASTRILSFQGKLTDSANNPIIKETNILFSIYNGANAGQALWQENDFVKPDSDGSFSVLLGNNNIISDSLFSQNPKLFLGIKVGDGPELNPRQELATIPLASNAQTLQGLEPITSTTKTGNVILALDSSGNLNIADSKTHTFQSIGGQFILSGSVLSLVTALGTNSNVEIAPDGLGKIDLQKPIFNSSNNNNLSGVPGAVEFADNVAVLATTSAQSAFYINQNSTGPLISASVSGIAKFTVGNDGSGFFGGDLGINGANLNSTAATFSLLNSGIATLNIGGSAKILNLGVSGGSASIKSNLILSKDFSLSSLTSNGGILYTNESGKVLQLSAGSSSDCLMGGSNPSFSPCANLFNNILTASISGNLIIMGATGIGTTSASAKFEVANGQTKIEISTQYSQRLCHSGTDGSLTQGVLLGDCSTGGADIAEYYGSKDVTIEPGDIIAAAPGAANVGANSKAYVNKSDSSYQGSVVGIVSTNPYDSFGRNFDPNEYSFPVALAGRVPVKISLENGPIKAGDLLTSSSIPGVAMKATQAGVIVGKALEDINNIDESKVVGFYDPENKEYRSKSNFPDIPTKPEIIKIVKIYAFVNISWHDPNVSLAKNGDLTIINSTNSGQYSISNKNNETLNNIAGFFSIIAANIKTGIINASEVVTNSLVVATDNIIVNGQNLKDYIVQTVSQNNLVSPIQTNEISTNIISPLSSDSVTLKGKLVILSETKDPDSSHSAQNDIALEVQGNASFSGQLSANSLQTTAVGSSRLTVDGNATVSGTLRAKNIVADSISGFIDIASFSAQVAYVPNLKAEQGLFNQGLMVFGSTSLSDLSVTGQLSIGGTMFVTQNSIETLGVDLSLQSLRQGGLSIMGGLVYIDTDGNLKVKGNVVISGKLAVSEDIVASGSGTFAKLNFSFVEPALALSPTELIASSSAGTANISSYQDEVTIKNYLVTDKSVIYITPVGTPSAQSPFLMRQNADSFTVGVGAPNKNPIPFNWLIVN